MTVTTVGVEDLHPFAFIIYLLTCIEADVYHYEFKRKRDGRFVFNCIEKRIRMLHDELSPEERDMLRLYLRGLRGDD